MAPGHLHLIEGITTVINEITVGAKEADILGRDEKAIQSAILLAKNRNISRVRVLKGIYMCKNSIMLKSGIELVGEGNLTVIRRVSPEQSVVMTSVNHYERVICVKHSDLFPVGCGITIKGVRRLSKESVSTRATVVAKNGHQLLLDKPYLGENFWLEEGEVTVNTLVPLVYCENLHDVSIGNLQIDGNIPFRAMEYGGGDGICLKNCQQVIVHHVYSHNNNGDGIGFEISSGVTVEHCLVENNAMSIHAGSGSFRMHVRNNTIRDNKYGFYYCWGIQQGLLENNEIRGNATYGISIGFHDSYNIIRRNQIMANREVGIIFRDAHHPSQAPRGDTVENNLIDNNGPKDDALGIKITFKADDIKLIGNKIVDTRKGRKSTGILIEKTVQRVSIEKNEIIGFKKDVVDNRSNKRGRNGIKP
jgi:hypothetical protein